MTADPTALEIGRQLRAAAERAYGNRFKGLVLYGSRARGDYELDSDIDILLLLAAGETPVSTADLMPLNRLLGDFLIERGMVVTVVPTTQERFRTSGLPFYMNVRSEGVSI